MNLSWILAILHLLGLGIGLGAVFARGYALKRIHEEHAMRHAVLADALWGVAALIWISTGVLRAFFGFEKGTEYYVQNPFFHIKMTLLFAVLAMEIRPIIVFTRWRKARAKGESPDLSSAGKLASLSYGQAAIVVLMVVAASAMARGIRF